MSSGIWRKRPVANQVASQPQREPRAALSVLVEVHVDKVLAVPECGAPGVPLVSLRLLVFLVVAALERRLRILAEGLEAFLAVSVQGHLPGRDRNSFTGTHLSLCSGVRAGKLSSAVAQLRMVVRRWPSQKANVPRLLGGANSAREHRRRKSRELVSSTALPTLGSVMRRKGNSAQDCRPRTRCANYRAP
uniref:Uncharacterized protein n=1 Tax=Rhipicephalus zambeziensis TaxID=60191 RepID=A0A224YAI1_9ACAR